jgi:hypothetical protein
MEGIRKVQGYVNPYLGGVLLGIVLFLSFHLTGSGLGASGAMNKIEVGVLQLVRPSHIQSNSYLTEQEGGSDNAFATGGVVMLIGTFVGGMISGLVSGRFGLELRKGPRVSRGGRLIAAFLGGALMGYGARLARGCTSGQALSGGATLAVGSWAFMFSVFGGGYLLAYFMRKLWN